MKAFIITILLIAVTSSGISQTASAPIPLSGADSFTCLPNAQLRVAIKKIEGAKILQQEFNSCKFSNALMQRIIKVCDSINQEGRKLDSTQKVQISVVRAEMNNVSAQLGIERTLRKNYEGALGRQQKITFTVAGIGIVISGTLLILLIYK